MIFSCFAGLSEARSIYVDPEVQRYQEYNPDGRKYEFVKSYIHSLSYIYQNDVRNEEIRLLTFEYLQEAFNLVKLRDILVVNNINLRVARNFIKKYKDSQNGLILKVSELYTQFCDDLIEINDEEKEFYNKLYENSLERDTQGIDKKKIVDWQQYVNEKRKEIMMDLLESSLLVTKVLISDKTDGYGELSYLGISDDQRHNLLTLLGGFKGEEFKGNLRGGQSFVEGSVSVLRQILQDDDYRSYY